MNENKLIIGISGDLGFSELASMKLLSREILVASSSIEALIIDKPYPGIEAALGRIFDAEGAKPPIMGINLYDEPWERLPDYYKELLAIERKDEDGANETIDGVRLCRRLLSEADGKYDMVFLGSLRMMELLLCSEADDISEKHGRDLVREKVRRIWIAGGGWIFSEDADPAFSRTEADRRAASHTLIFCPVPIYLLGNDAGRGVDFRSSLNEGDYLFRVSEYFSERERGNCTRPLLLCAALLDDMKYLPFQTERGYASVDERDGKSYFRPDKTWRHYILRRMCRNEHYASMIEMLIADYEKAKRGE